MSCVFCAIVRGEAPASVVFGDERVLAFLDIRPVTIGHLLVVPRAHATYLAELDPADGTALFAASTRIAAALRGSGLPCAGVNLFYADGEEAGQEIFHAHLHVIPRTRGDGFRVDAEAWRSPAPNRATLDEHAAAIRAMIEPPTR